MFQTPNNEVAAKQAAKVLMASCRRLYEAWFGWIDMNGHVTPDRAKLERLAADVVWAYVEYVARVKEHERSKAVQRQDAPENGHRGV